MKAIKKFLTADYYIQTVLGLACILLSIILKGLGIMLLLPFGIWQMISSLVFVFIFKDKKRVPHLIFVAIWGTILGILMLIDFEHSLFLVFYVIILPAGIGVWYYRITRKNYLEVKNEAEKEVERMEDILDADIE